MINLQEELENTSLLDSIAEWTIAEPVDVPGASSSEVSQALNEAVDAVADSSDAIANERVFGTFASMIKYSDLLQGATLNKVLDSLVSGFNTELASLVGDAHPSEHAAYKGHRDALETYAFLLQLFITLAERGAAKSANETASGASPSRSGSGTRGRRGGRGGSSASTAASRKRNATGGAAAGRADDWSWSSAIPEALRALAKALKQIRTERIWQTTRERDTFLSCFLKPAERIAQSDVHMKNLQIQQEIYKILCLATKNHGQSFGVQTTVLQNLQYYEHLAEPMAELVIMLAKDFDYTQLGEEVLRDISGKTFNDKTDAKGCKSFSRFLVHLSERNPRLVLKQVSLLQGQLDSEAYQIRNAVVECIGNIIRELVVGNAAAMDEHMDGGENGGQNTAASVQAKQIDECFDLVLERFLDLNSHVRSKAVTTVTKLLDLPTKSPEVRLRLTRLAIRNLSDKSSIVRKNCIILLKRLITTHPYGAMYGGDLNRPDWQERYNKVLDDLKPLEDTLRGAAEAMASGESQNDGDRTAMQTDEEEDVKPKIQPGEDEDSQRDDDEERTEPASSPEPFNREKPSAKQAAESAPAGQINYDAMSPEELFARVDQDQLGRLQLLKRYHADARAFIRLLEDGFKEKEDDTPGAIFKVIELLYSKAKSEVLEAIDFLTIASQYRLEASDEGIKAMLHLIWSKDASTIEEGREVKSVRKKLIESYKQLYFEPLSDLSPKDNVNRIARNMIELTFNATLAEITSLEELLSVIMTEDAIHEDVINKLWQVYSTPKDISRAQRRGAIIVLGMLAITRPEIISDHVDLLLKVGLGPVGKRDLVLAKFSCLALRRIGGSEKKVKGSLSDKSVRLPMDSPIFSCLRDLLEIRTQNREWFGMAEHAINTIYVLGDQPDALCTDILRCMSKRVFSTPQMGGAAIERAGSEATTSAAAMQEDDATERQSNATTLDVPGDDTMSISATPSKLASQSQQPGANEPIFRVDPFQLAQLIFAAGHCAIKQLVHLELVEREYKRRKAEAAKANNASKGAQQDELDQVVGSVEDDMADLMHETKERELLYGDKSLFSIFAPMTVAICRHQRTYSDATLRIAAVLSLGKFMCVSARFCEDNLILLFSLFESSKSNIIRSNAAIALGDMAIAFSTIMDDNSDRLYDGLAAGDLNIKKNTLMVLTHLILNGMIKVKGQLGEMAKCLEDDETRIRNLAKLFFSELATKENAIYNNLPDIVSSLSSGKHRVNEEMFANTMTFIFKFIEKEKQAEAIIEKLCQRFGYMPQDPVYDAMSPEEQKEVDERRWRDIALCLSMLPYKSEKSVKKLQDALPMYQDKLGEPTVYKRFEEILNKARQANKKEGGLDLREFEEALAKWKAQGEEVAGLEKKIGKAKTKQTKRQGRKQQTQHSSTSASARRSKRAARQDEEEEEEEEEEDEDEDEGEDQGEEEEQEQGGGADEDDEEEEAPPRPKRKAPAVQEDEEEDDDDGDDE